MQVSGYPSNSQFINISGDTMQSEILSIEGINPKIAKLQNINLMFGEINSIEYCSTMFNFPKLHELYSKEDISSTPKVIDVPEDELDEKPVMIDEDDDDF